MAIGNIKNGSADDRSDIQPIKGACLIYILSTKTQYNAMKTGI